MFGLLENLIDIVKAPVEIAADIAQVVTQPIADAANTIVDEVKDLTK